MKYRFSAERQLFFYVNIRGQQRLVKFGERNAFGASEFITLLRETAEAIRKHPLYKRGVIKEQMSEELPPVAKAEKPQKATGVKEKEPKPQAKEEKRATEPKVTPTSAKKEILEARNFTQAKSLLAKKLGISYGDIKTPDQMQQLAAKAGIEIVYKS